MADEPFASVIVTWRFLACTAWLLQHRMLVNRGFVLRRRGLSTDTLAVLIVGVTATMWSASVLFAVHKQSTNSGHISMANSIALAVEAPIIVQIAFIVWLCKWTVAKLDERHDRTPHLWRSIQVRGPFDWETGLGPRLYAGLCVSLCLAVGISSASAFAAGFNTISPVLSLAGLVVFLYGGAPKHPYGDASHAYSDDTLRISLPTTHHEGTVYVLPSSSRGFDAAWSPKIAEEHKDADAEMMVLFDHMRAGRWLVSEPLQRLRTTMARFRGRVFLSKGQAQLLAAWIHADNLPDRPRRSLLLCARAPGTHLVGRDLMYALCHAEYLVFMSQRALEKDMKEKMGRLRLLARSGAGSSQLDAPPVQTIGFRPGLEGYREAVSHIYSIFDLPADQEALEFHVQPPSFSVALSSSPSSIDEYVSELWDLSTANSESTFSALYFFTTVWFMEMGNVNGFNIFPLRCQDTHGDVASQQMMWRQFWYSACVAQLISCVPILFGAFSFGLFP
ncbi:uncharacterized protein J7T54_005867 [Emericellopsis cladophorae]|uniref:Uncharacterized protein n=1 Tax=Emericellopsis cladophorae TaxID=2686198 RepID=A0A9P9XVV1_9HYPO|nr:uncharacterized protein J7T54_005867 [Emericellopsis cladophorae]KAI6778764.1 hypothetical protein J7T54_005867 [Emericellopsis cladophorae]